MMQDLGEDNDIKGPIGIGNPYTVIELHLNRFITPFEPLKPCPLTLKGQEGESKNIFPSIPEPHPMSST